MLGIWLRDRIIRKTIAHYSKRIEQYLKKSNKEFKELFKKIKIHSLSLNHQIPNVLLRLDLISWVAGYNFGIMHGNFH